MIKTLITVLFLIVQLSAVSAQSVTELYQLYEDHDLNEIQKQLTAIAAKDTEAADYRFFRTLFLEDGAKAAGIYEKLLPESKGLLRKLVAEKLAEYYYAKGFYVKSGYYTDISKKADNKPVIELSEQRDPSPTDVQEAYNIQVGAFGKQSNAHDLREFLQRRKISSKIVKRIINNKTLYCVWIPGKKTYSDTVEFASEIKQKYQLPYRILNN